MKIDIERELRSAVKSGIVLIGSNETVKAVNDGSAKIVILASNCPDGVADAVKSAGVATFVYHEPNVELGTICGKPYPIASLAVVDPGESEILALGEG